MQNESLKRQEGFISTDEIKKYTVHLIGCGAIGSVVAFTLAKMGVQSFILYDYDYVSVENMSNQFFMAKQLKQSKTEALHQILENFSDSPLNVIKHNKFRGTSEVTRFNDYDIVISAVDNMSTRKQFMDLFEELPEEVRPRYYIECRMALQEFRVFVLHKGDRNAHIRYRADELYDEDQAVKEACTEKSIMYTPMGVANIVGKVFANIVKGVEMNFYGISMGIADLSFELPRLTLYRTKKQAIAYKKRREALKEIEEKEIVLEDQAD